MLRSDQKRNWDIWRVTGHSPRGRWGAPEKLWREVGCPNVKPNQESGILGDVAPLCAVLPHLWSHGVSKAFNLASRNKPSSSRNSLAKSIQQVRNCWVFSSMKKDVLRWLEFRYSKPKKVWHKIGWMNILNGYVKTNWNQACWKIQNICLLLGKVSFQKNSSPVWLVQCFAVSS